MNVSRLKKSLSIAIPYNIWDNKTHQIINALYNQKQIDSTFSEMKEKIMGTFHLLTQNTNHPTLREIMNLAFPENGKNTFLFSVYLAVILLG